MTGLLQVMLVEDEILVRVGIKSIVDWEEHGYTVIGEAADGAEAIEKIRQNAPDIVMTDLIMSPVDGFELIKTLKRDFPAIRIVVLSCHNDFQNVKEAMRLGADDYIFKLTIRPDELIRTLDAVRSKAGLEAAADRTAEAGKIVHHNLDAIKSKLIHAAIDRSYVSAAEWRNEHKRLHAKVDLEQDYMLVYVSADEFDLPSKNSRIKERELLKFSMLNFVAEAFERYEAAEIFDYDGGDCLVVVNADRARQTEMAAQIDSTFGMLHEYMTRYLGVGISGGLSAIHLGLRDLQSAYREAKSAMETRFFAGGGSLVHYRANPAVSADNSFALPPELDSAMLERHLEHMEAEETMAFLSATFDFLASCRHVTRHRVRNRLLEVLFPFVSVARKRGILLDEMKYDGGFDPQQVIAKYESLERIRAWFMQFAEDFLEQCRKMGQSRSREEIVQVKSYIADNLGSGEISVSAAAALVNMSESYFSHLFKKETGSSFVDYVNSVRIERAKQLLLQTNLKIYEIADRVGVDNANYFSLLFKKMTGVSPADFRK